jgi:hypothetical protein
MHVVCLNTSLFVNTQVITPKSASMAPAVVKDKTGVEIPDEKKPVATKVSD